jgi:hypothetical protein
MVHREDGGVTRRVGERRRDAPGRGRRDRGAVLVEFALILPLLICLILGAISGGFALSQKNSMTNAVREGGRLGATIPNNASWATSVRDRVVDLAGGDLTNAQVCARLDQKTGAATAILLQAWPSGGSCPSPLSSEMPAIPTSTPNGACVVRVWSQRETTLDAFFFRIHPTLEATVVGRYERACP